MRTHVALWKYTDVSAEAPDVIFREKVLPNRRYNSTRLHDVTSQNAVLYSRHITPESIAEVLYRPVDEWIRAH